MTTPERPPELPWAQIPHWIMLSDLSRGAKLIYVLLVMYVDRTDLKNRRSWPTQKTLARLAGYSRTESIDQCIRELEAFGIVKVERGRNPAQPLRKRNVYRVHLAADSALRSYRGPLSAWAVQGEEATEPYSSSVPEPGPSSVREPHSNSVEVDLEEEDLKEKDQPFAPRFVSRPPPATNACGRPLCRDGFLKVGINKVPCHICSPKQRAEWDAA